MAQTIKKCMNHGIFVIMAGFIHEKPIGAEKFRIGKRTKKSLFPIEKKNIVNGISTTK